MDEEDEETGTVGCQSAEHTHREECLVPREEATTLVVPVPEGDSARKYPRYIIRPSSSQLRLFTPGMRNPNRAPPFDTTHWQEYLESYGRPMLTDVSQLDALPETPVEGATLPARSQIVEELTVPLCRLETEGSTTRLVFDPESSFTWTTYQLKDALADAQPAWRGFIERTLMFFPREHLEASHARGIFFDFRVGNPRLGPRAAVGDGGTNDPGRGLLLISFTALNRHRRNGSHPASEDALNAFYSLDAYATDSSRVVATFYHELGHFLRLPRGGRIDREGDDRFRRFFCAIVADGYEGHSLGYPEAFSEAYRYRLLGQACKPCPYTEAIREQQIRRWSDAANAETNSMARSRLERLARRFEETRPSTGEMTPGEEMDDALDELGMPTVASVIEARAAILAHLRG